MAASKARWNERLAAYDKAVALCPGIERKGKTMPYASVNGHMFSQLNKDAELGIRFSKEVQAKYMNKLNTTHFKSYGAVMQGYVLMPEALWKKPGELARYLQENHRYVQSLDPK